MVNLSGMRVNISDEAVSVRDALLKGHKYGQLFSNKKLFSLALALATLPTALWSDSDASLLC